MNLEQFDFIVAGAGIFGATVAERLAHAGKKVLIVEKRDHLAGNIYSYTDPETGIEVHKYGSHIFHTENDAVWDYLNQFCEFNDYVHTVDTRHEGKLYPMPINLDTINLLYGTDMDAEEAEKFVASEAAKEKVEHPSNFEEQGLSLVGRKLYEAFLKNYTAKQWSTDPKNLSADLLKRIPVRFSHDNRYFMNAKHQGIPKGGYTKIVENMLNHDNIEVRTSTDIKDLLTGIPATTPVVYCGQVDTLLDYEFGVLPYRSLRFEQETTTDTLGEAVINEADADVPYTRTHDYKYYQIHQPEVIAQPKSILCREYPADFKQGGEAYYPVNNPESAALYERYVQAIQERYPNLVLGGRLGAYQYWDMDKAVANALDCAAGLLQ